jgi:phage terminase small subunit
MKKNTPTANTKPLNIRQERFAELVAGGENATRAYIKAGYKVSDTVAAVNGMKLLRKAQVKAHIAELRKPQTRKTLLTKERKRELLREMAESGGNKMQDRLRAIEIDAKLAGHFEPDRTEIEVGPKTLLSIRDRAKQVSRALAKQYDA